MASSELERTRRYEVSDFPPGTRMMMGDRRDLDRAIADSRGTIKTVGKFRELDGGKTAVPVVYVSKRAKPFHVRHRVALAVAGTVLVIGGGITWAILAIGVWAFLAAIVVASVFVAWLNRYASGGGRHRSVSVTTTTTTNVRVR